MPAAEATRCFKLPSKTKLAAFDSDSKRLQKTQVKPLLRPAMLGLEKDQIKLSDESEDVVCQFAENAQSLLRVQSDYILFLHANVVRCRKYAAMQMLGMTERKLPTIRPSHLPRFSMLEILLGWRRP